jgi:hypothetical protein
MKTLKQNKFLVAAVMLFITVAALPVWKACGCA